jgi:hypothetical protein
MPEQDDLRKLVNDILGELTFLVAGLVAYYGLRDDVVERLTETLGHIRTDALRRVDDLVGGQTPRPETGKRPVGPALAIICFFATLERR